MASEDNVSAWKSDEYWSSQGLHLQHWIWQYQLGYALHPKIPIPTTSSGSESTPLRIADIGAGNGAWLLELSNLLPSAHLTGFDITPSNFPHPTYLPPKLSLHTWNAFTELRAEYREAFDIVHIRTMNSTIISNQVDPLLSNALAMLKPGGYLQWDEMDALRLACHTPEGVAAETTEQMVRLMAMMMVAQSKLHHDWLYGIEELLEGRGCEVVSHEVLEPKRELMRATTDNYLLVWRDVIRMLPETPMPLPPGMGLPESLSRRSFAEMLQKAVEETSKGASLAMPYHVTVARKKA